MEKEMIDRVCISLNNSCNFRCKYCHFSNKMNSDDKTKSIFSIEEVKQVINNLLDYVEKNNIQLFKLGIAGSGEPLLNLNELKEIVETINKSNMKNSFNIYTITNGYLVDEEFILFAYEHKNIFQVCISLDGYKDIHNKYRCEFDKVWSNIKLYHDKFGYMPQINTTITYESIENQDKLLNFFISEGIYKVNFSKVFGDNNEKLLVLDKEYNEFLIKAKEMGIECRQMKSNIIYDCSKYGRLCGVGKTNIYISKEGIYPCARFWKNPIFMLGDYYTDLTDIESKLKDYTKCPKHECYYEYNKGNKV